MTLLDDADVLVPAAGDLCEGPCWDVRTRRLFFVDILAGLVHAVDPISGVRHRWNVGASVSAVAPRRSGGWIAALERGCALFDDDWKPRGRLLPAPGQLPGTRFNDGGCDPDGRFWAGTLAYDGTPGAGALYRFDVDGTVTEVLSHVTTSNGLAWSAGGDVLYFVDTGKATIDRMRFDRVHGTVDDRRTLVTFRPDEGLPDGLTIDGEGFLWVALWDGGCIRRYSPRGELERTVRLPVDRVTSVAFGGVDLGDLFITTARQGLDEERRRRQPLAGSVFRYRPGVVTGMPPADYAG